MNLSFSNPGFQSLLNMVREMPVAVYTCDNLGKITFHNAAARTLWGRHPDLERDRWCAARARYRPDGTPIAPEEGPVAVVARGVQAGEWEEMVIERADGSRRHVRPYAAPLMGEDGRALGAITALMDITEDRTADAARARLAAIVESSDDAIVSKDLNGVIMSWNAGAERVFGYPPSEAIGRSITMLIPPDRLQEEDLVLGRIRRGESIEHYETMRRRRDGTLFHVSLTVSPIRDSTGRIIGASKIARDISDRKRAETALREADRRKDEFLATLAHELRNPLAPLRSGLDLLMTVPDPAQSRPLLEVMDRQLNHLTRLVGDLLEVSRIARGSIPLQKELLDLRAVVDSALEISRPAFESGGHRAEVDCAGGEFYVLGDRTRLTQVVSNLLNNAARYTPVPGTIHLSASHEADQVALRVRDPGIGIPADKLDAVFEMFVRSHGSNFDHQGLGIGLALARRLTELHGGKLTAHSGGLGHGSVFTLRLPLHAPATLQVRRPEPVRGAGSRRVLVVDDNRDAANSVALLLRALSHEVAVAHNGMDAMATGARFKPDTVFLDLGMPGMSGYEVAVAMRAEPWGRDLFIVALTGWGQPSDRDKTAAVGFDRHLVKPVPYADLVALLGTQAGPPRVH